jgi:hypothetical protein
MLVRVEGSDELMFVCFGLRFACIEPAVGPLGFAPSAGSGQAIAGRTNASVATQPACTIFPSTNDRTFQQRTIFTEIDHCH